MKNKKNKKEELNSKKDILFNKLNEFQLLNQKKLRINKIASNFFSILIILMNLTIFSLCIVAISLLSKEIADAHEKELKNEIIFPLIVAVFTMLTFIGSILIIVYSNNNKSNSYTKKSLLIQYTILKLKNDPSYNLEDSLNKFNEVEREIFEESNVNYKKIIKKVLESHNANKK